LWPSRKGALSGSSKSIEYLLFLIDLLTSYFSEPETVFQTVKKIAQAVFWIGKAAKSVFEAWAAFAKARAVRTDRAV